MYYLSTLPKYRLIHKGSYVILEEYKKHMYNIYDTLSNKWVEIERHTFGN